MRLLTNLMIWILSFVITVSLATLIIPSVGGAIIGAIIWLIVFSKTFKHFVVSVGNNEGWVIFDPLFNMQHELSSGWCCKFFWEKFYEKIDMRKKILVENNPCEIYPTINGVTIKIKWIIRLQPLKGYLINFTSFHQKNVETQLRSKIKAFLNGYITTRSDDEIIGGKNKNPNKGFEELHKAFELLFNEKKINDWKKECGIWTGIPDLYDADRDVEAQKALATKQLALALEETAKALVEASKVNNIATITFENAFEKAMILNKSTASSTVRYEGLPQDAKTLIVGQK
ncbi:MAG: hypothetical protein NUV47_00665 [Patescibacteria group bacterium]|nr:hypothetical protein [Patescibacteria group bacterium]